MGEGKAGSEQRREREDRGDRVERERERGGHDHLRERGPEENAARLAPVHHEARERREDDERGPEGEEQPGHRQARSAKLLNPQRERDPQEKIAERGDPNSADNQADVTVPKRAPLHAPILTPHPPAGEPRGSPRDRYPCTPGARSSAG
jgi:hypothetical protein